MRNFLRWLLRALIRLVARVEVEGMENLPAERSFVVASNHLGMLDPLLVFYILDRWDVCIPVAEKWEKNAFLRWLGKYFNFVFIDRFNPDVRAMRRLMHLIEQGYMLAIAPEGTRSRVGSLIPGRPGAAYLAARLNRPILPVALIGTEDSRVFPNLWRLRKSDIRVKVGQPFRLPPLSNRQRESVLQQYTDEIMCRIAVLLPAEYRGVYRDHPRLKELEAAHQV